MFAWGYLNCVILEFLMKKFIFMCMIENIKRIQILYLLKYCARMQVSI